MRKPATDRPRKPDLTPMQTRALRWLTPGTWWETDITVASGCRSLAQHWPDLVEASVRTTEHGPVAEYRLTAKGERVRSKLQAG